MKTRSTTPPTSPAPRSRRPALRRLLLLLVALPAVLALAACAYLQHPKFGQLPEGQRLERAAKSPNFAAGEFRNQVPTQLLTDEGRSIRARLRRLFAPAERLAPEMALPAVKTDLLALDRNEDVVVWLGHSSYYVQLAGKRILIDPVFSVSAAPIAFVNDAFEGASLYEPQDMPDIDLLLITHDHWDHLDHPTLTALQPRIGAVITGLGVGAHLERWGYLPQKVREADWYDAVALDERLTVHVLPARHYSGRLLTRSKTLWVGYALQSQQRKLFFSGDSGFGPHFEQIGQRFGGFDFAALDSGQYDARWPLIHMTPEQAAQAGELLNAKALMPAHVGKYRLARHAWDEPFERMAVASRGKRFRLLTPRIGEPVALADPQQEFSDWWKSVR